MPSSLRNNALHDLVFGIATLRAGRSGCRIPVGARFSVSVQTGPGTHPASYTLGTGSLVLRLRRGVDHSPSCSAEVKERVELYFYSTSEP